MRIILKVAVIILNIAFYPMKLFRVKRKVVVISRQDNKAGIDAVLLIKVLKKLEPSLDVIVLAKMVGNRKYDKIKYSFHMLKQMYHISTAKVVVLDGYCPLISVLKLKKSLRVVQIWHAIGAIKMFGYQILGKEEGRSAAVAEAFKMHRNYDVVTCTSEATRSYYAEAFNIEKSTIKIWGMPRVDYIKNLKEDREDFYTRYPKYFGKKIILYVPTFRVDKGTDFTQITSYQFDDRYAVIIRKHPLDSGVVNEDYSIGEEYNTYQLMKLADYIVTDYSAVGIEASLLMKPTFFYLYDYDAYIGKRGINVDLKREMSSAVCFEFSAIMEIIEAGEYDFGQLKRFKEKYIETEHFNNTARIGNEIIRYIQEDSIE